MTRGFRPGGLVRVPRLERIHRDDAGQVTGLDYGETVVMLPANYEVQRERARAGICARPIEVTRLDEARPSYICGCGLCPPPPRTCICGDRGTHRPEPGIGCTRPGCLCLEPAEPVARAGRPPNPGRRVLA